MIYLDHSATTPVDQAQKELILRLMFDDFGNPSSLHKLGVNSEKYLKKSRAQISKALGVNEKEILFTSGGTESNNFAIQGAIPKSKKGRLITSTFEHPSVLKCVEQMAKKEFDAHFIKIDCDGFIDLNELEITLSQETVLVSIMHINNEIGTIQPIEEIGQMIYNFNQAHNTKIIYHVDAVQSFGKLRVNVKKAHIDLLSFSAHKINGLKGIGGLYVREGVTLMSLLYGGGQEKGSRPGTENICGIASLGAATESTFQNLETNYEHVKNLKSTMLSYLETHCNAFEINGTISDRTSPYILNVSFRGIKGEVLLHTLEMHSIYVSTGSACSSKKKSYSHVLEAMALDDERLEGAIRISFSKMNTLEEVIKASEIICKEVKSLRSIIKRM
ncbi:cysteine desulfurase family protein [Fusibacter sp. 3D3]|uniref:cysteine desulfurase family protein n=1 Tax=Fusibacter sp. 3D3 TaxID=1048380 RepID=UPI0008585C86|nr:cysteine desulfurase family protein [Fusibacter sp. 3D3]GAU79193.1 cysteine desulfurase [Fusibacter sp. 3D3]